MMQSVSDILKTFNPVNDKYISREFQTYGMHLTEVLGDEKHKSLYMKLAKTVPRALLERALSFVIDSSADNKAKLFMWKLKELRSKTGSGTENYKQKQAAGKNKQKKSSTALPLFS